MWLSSLDSSRVGKVNKTDADGLPNRGNVISESGLYWLLMRSDKPGAKEFQDWLTKGCCPRSARTVPT